MVKRARSTPVLSFRLTRGAVRPLPLQLADQLSAAIRCGGLPADTRLPPTRRVAAALGVSRNTVLTAYAELMAAGLVIARVGDGSYVARAVRRAHFADPDGNRLFVVTLVPVNS